MSDTTYSIDLKGIDLPPGAKERIDAALKATVMSELGKLDLGATLSVEPVPAPATDGDRMTFPIPTTMGFIVREILRAGGVTAERSVRPPVPLPMLPFFPQPVPPMFDIAALEALCWRPDIRQAVINNCRALMDLLSRDEVALKNFSDLVQQLAPAGNDRAVFLIPALVAGGALLLGGIVGYASRK